MEKQIYIRNLYITILGMFFIISIQKSQESVNQWLNDCFVVCTRNDMKHNLIKIAF